MNSWGGLGQDPSVPGALPPGLQVASTGSRFGAWILDIVFISIAGSIASTLMSPLGMIVENKEYLRQLDQNPYALPTVEAVHVDVVMLAAFSALSLVATVAFYAFCWTHYRGTPGQKILSLQVADAETGRNLTLGSGLVRAVALYGVVGVLGVAMAIAGANFLNDFVPADYAYSTAAAPGHFISFVGWLLSALFLGLVSLGYELALLVSTSTDPAKRGWHDRLAGSLVAGKVSVPVGWIAAPYGMQAMGPGYPGYPMAPYPPQQYLGVNPARPQPSWPGQPSTPPSPPPAPPSDTRPPGSAP
jgi:uncharacterized RDD family membrane protein YckC